MMNGNKRRNYKGSGLMTVGLVLIGSAFLLTGYNMLDAKRATEGSHKALEQLQLVQQEQVQHTPSGQSQASVVYERSASEQEIPNYILNPDMDMPTAEIDGMEYIGALEIPSLQIELPVLSTWSYTGLKTAPCRYSGSAYLDNIVIAAHNYSSHFGEIKGLSSGDSIVFLDMDGNEFHYQVIELEVLKATSVDDMTAGDWDLTLFTCTVGGESRVTVRCEKTD